MCFGLATSYEPVNPEPVRKVGLPRELVCKKPYKIHSTHQNHFFPHLFFLKNGVDSKMAYGFIERISKEDEDVKTYLDEGMLFEAWIMCIRNCDVDADTFLEKWEQEKNLKNPRLTEDEMLSIDCEYYDCTRHNDDENINAYRVWV